MFGVHSDEAVTKAPGFNCDKMVDPTCQHKEDSKDMQTVQKKQSASKLNGLPRTCHFLRGRAPIGRFASQNSEFFFGVWDGSGHSPTQKLIGTLLLESGVDSLFDTDVHKQKLSIVWAKSS